MTDKIVKLATVMLIAYSLTSSHANVDTDGKERKAGYKNDAPFAGPSAITSQLKEDDEVKKPSFRFPAIDRSLEPWNNLKQRLNDEHGFQLGLAYTYLHQMVNEAPVGAENDHAGSGLFKLSGAWTLLNHKKQNPGKLVFNIDHRHAYTDIPPTDLGFATGYYGQSAVLLSDIGLVLGDLNWQQTLNNGNSGFIIGRYDPVDFFDVLGYANPWTAFQNAAILFNTSIALPDASTGIGGGHRFDNQWYVKGAVNDVNGSITNVTLFEDFGELYTTAEVGWSPSKGERYLSNVHLTVWHADERESDGIDSGKGLALGANWTWDETWMLFARAGWSEGTATFYDKTATLGMLRKFKSSSDLIGLATNWGAPIETALRDQYTTELFYRVQISQSVAITPSFQLIVDPSLNPDEDMIFYGGIRIRITM